WHCGRNRRSRGTTDCRFGAAHHSHADSVRSLVRADSRHVHYFRHRSNRASDADRSGHGLYPMNDNAPVIEAVDVAKTLGHGAGEVEALKGVSLALKGGEFTLLMGPSGSGKTTLLSILGCMLTPTRGTVRVRGESTTNAGAEDLARLRRNHVGYVFQSYHLF